MRTAMMRLGGSLPRKISTGEVIAKLTEIQSSFGKPVSLADLIVLAGCAAVVVVVMAAAWMLALRTMPSRPRATSMICLDVASVS